MRPSLIWDPGCGEDAPGEVPGKVGRLAPGACLVRPAPASCARCLPRALGTGRRPVGWCPGHQATPLRRQHLRTQQHPGQEQRLVSLPAAQQPSSPAAQQPSAPVRPGWRVPIRQCLGQFTHTALDAEDCDGRRLKVISQHGDLHGRSASAPESSCGCLMSARAALTRWARLARGCLPHPVPRRSVSHG